MRCNLYEIVEKFIAMVNLADEYLEVNLPYIQGGVKKSILLSGSPGNTATDIIGFLMYRQPALVAEILYYETKGLDMTLDVEREKHKKDIRQVLDLLKITLATNKAPAPGPRKPEDDLTMAREYILAVDKELRRQSEKITELQARNAELEKTVKVIKHAMTAEQDMLHE
jgi:hypothetical protein